MNQCEVIPNYFYFHSLSFISLNSNSPFPTINFSYQSLLSISHLSISLISLSYQFLTSQFLLYQFLYEISSSNSLFLLHTYTFFLFQSHTSLILFSFVSVIEKPHPID